jgi:molybdate transport system substrate-binding protein
MSNSRVRRTLLAVICWACLVGPGLARSQNQAGVTVFAAASLKNALDEVGAAFTAKTGRPVKISYAASSTLARQIEQGAPADVFISADSGWMNHLAGAGMLAAGSRRDVLSNHLALIAPAQSTVHFRIGRGMPLARALGDSRLAVAGPDVPAGKYAKAALTSLGVWDSVSGRLAPADNVRGALLFVARGEAQLGIVYDTDAKVEPKVRIVGLFPDDSHPPILYPAAVLAHASGPWPGAFLRFLGGREAVAIFRRYGFIVPPAASHPRQRGLSRP